MTALGVISEDVREIYAREVKACYHEAGRRLVGLSSWTVCSDTCAANKML